MSEELYGEVAWCAGDVRILDGCGDWSDEQCNEFLNDIEDELQAVMIERGWNALEDLLCFYKEDRDVRSESRHGQRGVQP